MDEQPQHDRATDPAINEAEAERDIAYTMHLDHHRPDNTALAVLTDRLITHCVTLAIGVNLIPDAERTRQASAAVTSWQQLAEHGPDHGALGNWSYAKHLAQTARDMLAGIREHRAAQPATFVGRETLPPVAADRP